MGFESGPKPKSAEEIKEIRKERMAADAEAVQKGAEVSDEGKVEFTEKQVEAARSEMKTDLAKRDPREHDRARIQESLDVVGSLMSAVAGMGPAAREALGRYDKATRLIGSDSYEREYIMKEIAFVKDQYKEYQKVHKEMGGYMETIPYFLERILGAKNVKDFSKSDLNDLAVWSDAMFQSAQFFGAAGRNQAQRLGFKTKSEGLAYRSVIEK